LRQYFRLWPGRLGKDRHASNWSPAIIGWDMVEAVVASQRDEQPDHSVNRRWNSAALFCVPSEDDAGRTSVKTHSIGPLALTELSVQMGRVLAMEEERVNR
jgi:hypothetical protein